MRSSSKILNGREVTNVAIVQTAPVFLDRDRTIEKACAKISEAAAEGANVIVFSEAWISGYPYWGEGWESDIAGWVDVRTRFYDGALVIPSEDTARLCAAAARANAVVIIGCNELDPRPNAHTIYNTLLFIDNGGNILGTRRKIMPTFVERAVWGWGDGSDLDVFETEFGRIGALICGENLMTLARARMIAAGEDLHVAVFPGAFAIHTGPKLIEWDADGQSFWGYATCRSHAIEAGAYVIASCGYITEDDLPDDFALRETVNVDYAQGGSTVYAPIAVPLVPPTSGDTIIHVTCAAAMIKVAKALVDAGGHYGRPDVLSLDYHPTAHQGRVLRAVESLKPAELAAIADRHEISVRDLETAAEALSE